MSLQRINLLRDGLEERRVPWSAGQVSAGVVAVVALLALWAGWLQWQLGKVGGQLAASRADIEQARAEVLTMGKALESRRPSTTLPQTLAAAREDLAGRRWLLATLRGDADGDPAARALSPLLEGLGRQRVEPLWLTLIVVDGAGAELGLRGRAAAADAVPEFLDRLGQEPALAGRRFRLFQLARPPEDSPEVGPELVFRLATGCATEALGSLCAEATGERVPAGRP